MTEEMEKIPVWCAGEDWCPVTATAEILGKKWHPVIIHRLIDKGEMGFNDLKREVDGVSSKVLTESLRELEKKGILDRDVINESPKRVEYSLTEPGVDMAPIVKEMERWGKKNLEEHEEEV